MAIDSSLHSALTGLLDRLTGTPPARARNRDVTVGLSQSSADGDRVEISAEARQALGRVRQTEGTEPSDEERRELDKLEKADREVRSHEQAHKAAAMAAGARVELAREDDPGAESGPGADRPRLDVQA